MSAESQAQSDGGPDRWVTFGQIAALNTGREDEIVGGLLASFWRREFSETRIAEFERVASVGPLDSEGIPTTVPNLMIIIDPDSLLRVLEGFGCVYIGGPRLRWEIGENGEQKPIFPPRKTPLPEAMAEYPLSQYRGFARSAYIDQIAIPLEQASAWCRSRKLPSIPAGPIPKRKGLGQEDRIEAILNLAISAMEENGWTLKEVRQGRYSKIAMMTWERAKSHLPIYIENEKLLGYSSGELRNIISGSYQKRRAPDAPRLEKLWASRVGTAT